MARRFVRAVAVGAVLALGCGDGTFLASTARLVDDAVGADIAKDTLTDCAVRLAEIPNVRFCHVNELFGPQHVGAYDVVTCMETLEHCTEPVVARVLADLA